MNTTIGGVRFDLDVSWTAMWRLADIARHAGIDDRDPVMAVVSAPALKRCMSPPALSAPGTDDGVGCRGGRLRVSPRDDW